MISTAASRSFALRSGIFSSAIASSCARLILATLSLCGTPDPDLRLSACLISTAAGGVLSLNVNVLSAKIVISNIFGQPDQEVNFSFQVAPEAILEEVVPRHGSFEAGNTPIEFVGYEHPHHINYLPGQFIMTTDDSSDSEDKLKVSDGDTIYIEYEDLTLPKPYTQDDILEIIATAGVVDSGFNFSTNNDKEIFVETTTTKIIPVSSDIDIPSWVKKNASWWSDGQINDPDFAKGIEYLVQENIISVPTTDAEIEDNANITSIPMWVRNNAAWWSEGHLTDVEFANGIQFLVSTGLIKV